MFLLNGIAWVIVIGLACLAFMFLLAGFGAMVGNVLALFKRRPSARSGSAR